MYGKMFTDIKVYYLEKNISLPQIKAMKCKLFIFFQANTLFKRAKPFSTIWTMWSHHEKFCNGYVSIFSRLNIHCAYLDLYIPMFGVFP